MRNFTLEYWKDDRWLVGRLVEFPGVMSQGANLAELEENIRDAYRLMVESDPPPQGVLVETRPIEV
jgi:predicted RNase H-like HicB family nuclease